MTAADGTTLRMERFFKASPERIFRAFTNAEELKSMWTSDDHPISALTVDARPGGGWTLTMRSKGAGAASVHRATYFEFRPPESLGWNVSIEADWAKGWKEMRVTLRFKAVPGGTMLSLVHEFFPSREARDGHAGGWGGGFDRLEKRLAAEA